MEGASCGLFTAEVLERMCAVGHTKTMSTVLLEAGAGAHKKDLRQVPDTHVRLGSLGTEAFFHGVHGLLPVPGGSEAPLHVCVQNVVGNLLDVYERQVRTAGRLSQAGWGAVTVEWRLRSVAGLVLRRLFASIVCWAPAPGLLMCR
jgi:hypothetical protein